MRYLTLREVLELHELVASRSGGGFGVRDLGLLESALAQPRQSIGRQDLYPGVLKKAAALGYFIIANHPFVDGNKRVGHAAMEVFLLLNGYELSASVEEQERTVLSVASGALKREQFEEWVEEHAVVRKLGPDAS